MNITCNSNVEIGYMRLYIPNNKVITNHTIYPMLEKGSSMTTFEPYQSQTYEVDLPVENLCSSATYYNENAIYMYFNPKKIPKTFTISLKAPKTLSSLYCFLWVDSTNLGNKGTIQFTSGETATATFTLSDSDYNSLHNGTTAFFSLYLSGANFDTTGTIEEAQIEAGSKVNTYAPYGTTPLELCKIGDYQDYFTKNSGKNLFDKDNMNILNGYLYGNQMNISTARQDRILYIECKPNTTYTISRIVKTGSFRVATYNSTIPTPTATATNYTCYNEIDNNSGDSITITTDGSSKYLLVHYGNVSSDSNIQESVNTIMINEGSTALPYEPYGTGQWCKYNAIGKSVLNGSETYYSNTSTTNEIRFSSNVFDGNRPNERDTGYCNYLMVQAESNHNGLSFYKNDANAYIWVSKTIASTIEAFKTWLTTHNTSIYYPLTTPYLSLIEDNNLIEQLDNLQNAMSYQGTTNIGQVSNDKPFIISVKALEQGSNEVVVNNIGNAYSKPLIALEGSGNVDIYLDNTQILKANVEDKMNIDIDKLEAYNPDTSALLNRQVIGNYNTMTLQPGNNTIRIDGALDKATISNYTRWI